MKKVLAAMILIPTLVVGCGTPPEEYNRSVELTSKVPTGEYTTPRFIVDRKQIFDDALAYGGERAIYIITDSETGKEYIGVSGIGISEVGSHSSGKSSIADER